MSLDLPYPWVGDPAVQGNFDRIKTEWTDGIYAPSGTVTSLPTVGQDGQIVRYLADDTNGVVWTFRYRAASASSYKWEFCGGAGLLSEVAAVESSASTTFVALSTAGPSVTLPLAGDYLVGHGSTSENNTSGANVFHSFDIGGTGASDVGASMGGNSSPRISGSHTRLVSGVAAATALVSKYRTTAGTAYWRDRWMMVTPVRVG